jgi:cytidylate kinase
MGKRPPVITIDGPAGAGKSTVARRLAEQLGLKFLDTGAMYRAFTWAALARNVDLRDPEALVRLIRDSHLDFERGRVMLDGWDITDEIRGERVTKNAVFVADPPPVRAELVKLQRDFGRDGGLVTEGRDQGSVVFPDAEFKFYLDAAIDVRAQRRVEELNKRGESATYSEISSGIADRDERDRKRPVGALRVPEGAIMLDTSHLTIDQVVAKLLAKVRESGA